MNKKSIIWISSVASVLVVILTALLIYYFGAMYPQFYKIAQQEFAIPGLKEGFTPQGITYDKNSDMFIVCGYMKDTSKPSRYYVINKTTKETVKYFTLTTEDGQAYAGHSAGVAVSGNNVWTVAEGYVYRFKLNESLAVKNAEAVAIVDSFESGNGADFVTVENNNLWVGEFYKEKKYPTKDTHKIETASGDINPAVSFCYEISNDLDYGVASIVPTKALSTIGLVQGMTFLEDGKIVLSTSYSLPSSNIYIYNNIFSTVHNKTIKVGASDIPLFVLDKESIEKTILAPCMSEEIELVDGRVYIMFESACNKYKMFTRTRMTNVQSIELK